MSTEPNMKSSILSKILMGLAFLMLLGIGVSLFFNTDAGWPHWAGAGLGVLGAIAILFPPKAYPFGMILTFICALFGLGAIPCHISIGASAAQSVVFALAGLIGGIGLLLARKKRGS